jgi:hypothetical protein
MNKRNRTKQETDNAIYNARVKFDNAVNELYYQTREEFNVTTMRERRTARYFETGARKRLPFLYMSRRRQRHGRARVIILILVDTVDSSRSGGNCKRQWIRWVQFISRLRNIVQCRLSRECLLRASGNSPSAQVDTATTNKSAGRPYAATMKYCARFD